MYVPSVKYRKDLYPLEKRDVTHSEISCDSDSDNTLTNLSQSSEVSSTSLATQLPTDIITKVKEDVSKVSNINDKKRPFTDEYLVKGYSTELDIESGPYLNALNEVDFETAVVYVIKRKKIEQ